MKILIPVVHFGKAGGYRTLSCFANEWIKLGADVYFVASETSDEPYYPTDATIIYVGNKGIISENHNTNLNISFIKKLKNIKEYLRLNSSNFDAVLANHNMTVFPIKYGSKTNNFYYIQAYEPEIYSWKKLKSIICKIIAWTSYKNNFVKIVNADIYMKYKAVKAKYVIYPGLDLNNYYRKQIYWDKNRIFRIGTIGRNEKNKGTADVIKAIEIVKNKGYNIEFVMAFNKLDCDDCTFVKPDGDSNLADFYRSVDLLIAVPTFQLGAVHYPIIESMACGTPLICTSYYPSNVSNSFPVSPHNPEEISREIEYIINNYDIAINKADSARKAVEQFEWNKLAKKFLYIMEDEIRRKGK